MAQHYVERLLFDADWLASEAKHYRQCAGLETETEASASELRQKGNAFESAAVHLLACADIRYAETHARIMRDAEAGKYPPPAATALQTEKDT